ncbi:hypothetical protein [Fusobacterium varium]|uniref:hypothetical protein n=1 Tax=Fusobacterium varium TaxID=856 RepID=UPI0022E860B6|nr:hypothetical protein [Fusobacterium varium]
MKKIVIYSNGINYGGIEVFYIEMAEHMKMKGISVCFLSDFEDTLYKKIFNSDDKIEFIVTNRKPLIPSFYYFKNELNELKKIGKKICEEYFKDQEVIILTQDFYTLSTSIGLFGGEKNIYLKTASYHPEDWAETTTYLKQDGFVLKKKKNKIWNYQRKLFQNLDENDALWLCNETNIKHKNWFYELELRNREFVGFPIADVNVVENIHIKNEIESGNKIKILWTGRFDYFKNVAIIHIKETLEKIAQENRNLKIIFTIIGYGNKKYEKEIIKNINSSEIEILLLGRKNPKELKEIFYKNDIGIGMGTSVLRMAQFGLASILVDSVNKKNKKYLKAEWVFNTFNDAGDNFYWELTGHKKTNRKDLEEILQTVINNKELLKQYQVKSKEYVKEKYSLENNFRDIFLEISNTKLEFLQLKIFEKSIVEKVLRRIAYWIFKK